MTHLRVDIQRTLGEFELHATFQADRGITVLFGPSGAGKSMTMSIIAGILRPDRGDIALGERTLDDTDQRLHVATRDRRLGYVFQDALLLPHRTALDNVAMAVRTGTRTERRAQAARLLADVGAENLASARPRRLSGGERQRVALARALAGQPELLLLDEPFSALDLPTRHKLRALVRRLVSENDLTALFVTHDHDEALELADALLRYEPGRTLHSAHGNDIAAALRGPRQTETLTALRAQRDELATENAQLRAQLEGTARPSFPTRR